MSMKATKHAILALCTLLILAVGFSTPADAQASTKYKSKRWGFCIAYPSRLLPYEGVNKAGVSLIAPEDHHGSNPITIGALPNMESPSDPGRQMTIEEDAASDLDSIGDGSPLPPTRIRVMSKKEIVLSGVKALRMRVTYTQHGVARMEDTVYVIRDNALYTLELRCGLGERALYEATFRSIIQSFQWECK
jgi:hypothetical protein